MRSQIPFRSKQTHRADFDIHKNFDVKDRAIGGAAVTLISQSVQFLLGIASVTIMARLLRPEDFGLIAMVGALIGFVSIFATAGLSAATIQRENISHEQISTLFWINLTLGGLIACLIAAISPFVATFYQEPRLTLVTIALGAGFLFSGATIQHQALLRREMRFFALAVVNILGNLFGLLSAIITACLGWNYWALVTSSLVSSATIMLGVWIGLSWRPGWPKRKAGTRSMLTFGGYLTAFDFVNYFARNLDNILIGRYWGAGPLGFYSKAYNLLVLPIQQINAPIAAVAIPALSRLQSNPSRFKNHYLGALSIVAFLTAPIAGLVVALSSPIILVVLGSRWESSIPIIQLLSISIFLQPCVNTVGWIYTSLGYGKRMAIWGLIACPFLMFSFIIGLPYGPKGVAFCYSLASLIIAIPAFMFAIKGTSIHIVAIIDSIWRQLVAAGTSAGIIAFFYRNFLVNLSPLFSLFYGSLIYVTLYLAIDILLLKDPAGRVRTMELLRIILRRVNVSKP